MWPFKKRRPETTSADHSRDTTSQVAALLESWRTRTLESDDGDVLMLELSEPATAEDIDQWQHDHRLAMPAQLADLLRYSNGASLFDLDLVSLGEMHDYGGLIPFHNWGNGDFDCIDQQGRVFFTNHNPDVRVAIADSLLVWLQAVTNEIERTRCLRHPGDYRQSAAPGPGLYASVLEELKDTDCELNR